MLMGLRFVSQACQVFKAVKVFIEDHWLACTGSHLAGKIYQLTYDIGHGLNYILCAMGPQLPFNLEYC